MAKKSPAKKSAPKRGRDVEKSRKEILEAAFWEVFVHGFQGVSIDDILKKTTLTKGAFYHIFPKKLDLGYALVDEVISPMITKRWLEPLEKDENPLDGILKQLRTLIGKAPAEELKLGCPLNNLTQEMAPLDAGFQLRLQQALNLWISGIERHLQRGKEAGYIKKDVNTRQTAHFIVMAHEGFYGMLKGLQDPKAFEALYDSLKIFFRSLSTETASPKSTKR